MPGFFEFIASREPDRPMEAAWMISGEAAGAKALFAREEDQRTLLFRDGAFPSRALDALSSDPGAFAAGCLNMPEGRIYLENVSRERKLVICGAGHVALSVVRLGLMLGWDVTVIEDREKFARKARDAGARQVVCRPFGEALDDIGCGRSTAFVVMTREHAHDMECLRRILNKPYAYVGMMGSRSRSEQVRRQLLAEGADPAKAEGIHMPIGLAIGSRTPEEIAVSVAAELIREANASDPGEAFPPGMAEELAARTENAEPAVLAMIVEKSGEAPRRPGARMLVRSDGSFTGTVGGGEAEARILRTCGEMIREKTRGSRLVRVEMTKGSMACGGAVTVFLTPV